MTKNWIKHCPNHLLLEINNINDQIKVLKNLTANKSSTIKRRKSNFLSTRNLLFRKEIEKKVEIPIAYRKHSRTWGKKQFYESYAAVSRRLKSLLVERG